MMLANSQLTGTRRHGGSGGMNIGYPGIGLTVFPANLYYSGDLGAHEFAHSFAELRDEYWPGTHFADCAANMFYTGTGSACSTNPWTNWLGGDIGTHSHYTDQGNCDPNYNTVVDDWWKPTTKEFSGGSWINPKCKMESIDKEYCVVCREGIIEELHDRVPLIKDYSPSDDMVLTPTDGSAITFSCDLLKPNLETGLYNYNQVKWELDGNVIETDAGDVDYEVVLNCSLDAPFNTLTAGVHILKAIVEDATPWVHADNEYHEQNHIYTIEWVINYRPKCCTAYAKSVTGPHTWSGGGTLGDNVTVSSGTASTQNFTVTGTLTLGADLTLTDCNVRMGDEALIIVEEGVTFTLNNTNIYACNNIWEGIQVWGNPNENQSHADQGKVLINSGSEISDARWGVMVASGEGETHKTGGIIQAQNSTFRNNRKDVAFMKYDFPTQSFFDDCDFITDAPLNSTHYYINGTHLGTNSHVSVWGMVDLVFEDCDFFCDLDDSWPSGSPDGYYYPFNYITRAQGISYADARLLVGGMGVGNNFSNLINGLDGFNTSYSIIDREINVEYNTFTNCEFGVNMHTGYGNKIKNNTFNLPIETGWEPQNDNMAVGVNDWFNHNSLIQANTFNSVGETVTTDGSYLTHTVGVAVHGSDENSRVTFNYFYNQLVGTQTEDNNVTLEILCNNYNHTDGSKDNDIDWLINPNYVSSDILGPQGTGCASEDYRAGNKFYDGTNPNIMYGDPVVNPFLYVSPEGQNAHASNDDETPNRYDNNGVQQTAGITECDIDIPDITCGTTIIQEFTIPEMEDTLRLLDTAWSDLLDEYTVIFANLDSGVTDTVLKRIDDAGVSNANLTDSLINYWSPLSDEALLAVTERSPFFTAMQYHDIIIANSPVANDVWPSLVLASATAFPDSVISAQGTDTIRTITVLQREAALLNTAIRIPNIL